MHRYLAITLMTLAWAGARAETSANIGFLSDYIYRGVPQAASVANGGIDWQQDGFYLGAWAAAVKPGIELDIYGGYKHQFENDWMAGAGFTSYYYSDDFDDTYQELNLYAGHRWLNLEYSTGRYYGFEDSGFNYDFLAVSGSLGGLHARLGHFGKGFPGNFFELGYGGEFAELDLDMSVIRSSKGLANNTGPDGLPTEDTFLVFSIKKRFSL